MYKPTRALIVLVIGCLSVLYGCNKEEASNTTNEVKTNDTYAKVNDTNISKEEFDRFASAKRQSQPEANFTDSAIADEMIASKP